MKLSTALEGYWLDREIYLTDGTVTRYGYVFDRFSTFMGDVEIEDITSQDIKRFIRYLTKETNLSKRSVFDYHAVLSTFWTWAEKELGINHVIRGKVDKPKYTQRKIEPIPMKDVQQLVKACEWSAAWKGKPSSRTRRPTGLRDKAIVIVMVDCGIRVSELCHLTVADYDKGRLHVRHGKGDKERYLPLGNRAMKAIWRYLAKREDAAEDEPLFATQTGSALDRNNVRHLIERLAEKEGIRGIHPHKFRHTFAIEFLRNGGNPFELKELLGHTTLTMVMNYVALAQVDLDNAIKRSSPADKWKL